MQIKILSHINKKSKLFLMLALFFLAALSFSLFSEEKKNRVFLESAEELLFDKERALNYQILRGNVRFRHEDTFMTCDSAYFYEKQNAFDAFGHVFINQGDTLLIYGDYLYYDGDEKMARLRKNIRMINNSITLTTDSFNYDRKKNIAYYFSGGTLKDSANVLISERGRYFPNLKTAVFRKNVELKNKDIDLYSDTLQYNTETEVATILGPSEIFHNDVYIYSENGWYDTMNEQSEMKRESYLRNSDGQFLTGDILFYDQAKGLAKAFGDVEMIDSTNYISIKGNTGVYYELERWGFITDSTLITEFSSPDSLFFHSDSVSYYNITDTMLSKDYINIEAYRNVRFYKSDLQGKCDSLHYSSLDSIVDMYYYPILWSEENQLSGDFIKMYLKDKELEKIYIENTAFIISQEGDTTKFNQIHGKEITAYAVDNKLRKVEVNGNAQSVYYPREDDGSYVGGNKAESSFLYLYLADDNKINKIVMVPSSEGVFRPLEKIGAEEAFLKDFGWYDSMRPKKKEDIFLRIKDVVTVEVKPKVVKKSRKKQTGYQLDD